MSASDIPDQVQERLRHIAEVSKNARTTWFALIGVLLFSTIAIGGVADRDFFTYASSVQLPLVGVSVPVVGFFYAGPVIVLGLYTYFHLYLIKLWRALSWVGSEAAPGLPLDDVAYPWLISDAAIMRKTRCGEACTGLADADRISRAGLGRRADGAGVLLVSQLSAA